MAKKVLIVEDHSDLQRLFKIVLQKGGYDVETVTDGFQAHSFLEEKGEQVDLLLACWEQSRNMRLTLGEGIIEIARDKNPDVRIILMTTGPNLEHLDYLRSVGADYVLVKPFRSRDLFNALEITKATASRQHGS